ncbi:MAG: hypothetical protein ACOZNI_31765 [Myxococcota bacterium]
MLTLLLLACPDSADDTGKALDDTGEPTGTTPTDDTGGTAPYYDTDAGDCDVNVYETTIADASVVYDGGAYGALAMHGVRVVETQAEWDAVLALSELDGSPASVDFATHRILVGAEWESSTCGLSLVDARLIGNNYGGPHLEVTIHDSSGGCDTVCDAEGGYAYVMAVPRSAGDFATVCRILTPGC